MCYDHSSNIERRKVEMAKKPLTREQKVFNRLAATGKYVNTGKVLIGLAHVPRPAPMSEDEELLQNILLGNYRLLVRDRTIMFSALLLTLLLASLFVACST
jgi:hypothetical protein